MILWKGKWNLKEEPPDIVGAPQFQTFLLKIFRCHIVVHLDHFYYKELSLIDLFHNGGLSIYYFICMLIILSDLANMCKIQKNTYFQTRSERLNAIQKGIYLYGPPLWMFIGCLERLSHPNFCRGGAVQELQPENL